MVHIFVVLISPLLGSVFCCFGDSSSILIFYYHFAPFSPYTVVVACLSLFLCRMYDSCEHGIAGIADCSAC